MLTGGASGEQGHHLPQLLHVVRVARKEPLPALRALLARERV